MSAFPYPASASRAKTTTSGVTLTAQDLADETGASVDRAGRVLPAVAEIIAGYAPDAPTAVSNEAAIRYAGYLLASDYGGIRSESLGPQSADYITNHAAMFRNSGAMALLTRFKVRRGGIIG